MSRAWRGVFVMALAAGLPADSRAQVPVSIDSTPSTWATVTYVTGSSVYVGAGRRAGLVEGTHIDVIRGGTAIAELAVEYVSSTSASCRIVTSTSAPVVGDSVRFIPARRPDAVTGDAAAPAAPRTFSRSRAGALHGRIGLRQFVTEVSPSPTGSLTQPAIDARLDGQSLAGTKFGLTMDIRAHRGRQSGTTTGGASTRVYQAALHLDGAAGPGRLTIGRQFATSLSPVGIFDGFSAAYTWTRTGAGLFVGTQPDAADFGWSDAIREYGAWFGLHGGPGAATNWSFTTGAVGSYVDGAINREFAYLQAQVTHRVFSVFAAQELDYNRGWRAAAESSSTTPTSTFVSAHASLGPAVSINAGYDNRRNIRLYRDFVNPEVAFDDAFREGVWAGTQVSISEHLRGGVDFRSTRGGSAGSSDSWTASAGLIRLTPLGIGMRARATRYSGSLLEGELRSVSLDMEPGGRFRVETSMGSRTDRSPGPTEPASTRWVGADFDTGLGRSFFLTLSAYRETSAGSRLTQYFASLSYRF